MYQPYQVMAIERHEQKKDEEEKQPVVVLEPKMIMAKDEKSAAMKILLTEDSLKKANPDRLEIFVRPF